jgi:hypothetical protein
MTSWYDNPPPETRHPHAPGGQRVALRQGSSTLYNLLTDHPSLCSGRSVRRLRSLERPALRKLLNNFRMPNDHGSFLDWGVIHAEE